MRSRPFPTDRESSRFGRLGSASGLHKVLIPLNPPAFYHFPSLTPVPSDGPTRKAQGGPSCRRAIRLRLVRPVLISARQNRPGRLLEPLRCSLVGKYSTPRLLSCQKQTPAESARDLTACRRGTSPLPRIVHMHGWRLGHWPHCYRPCRNCPVRNLCG